MDRAGQRAMLLACVVWVPLATGCVFPYCVPRLDYTQAVKVEAPPGEIHAFRLDTITKTADLWVVEWHRLSELPVTSADRVAPQLKPSVASGLAVVGALTYRIETRYSVGVRLYRPGFELVEIESWERAPEIVWKPAADLEAQEKVLDRLFPLDRSDEDRSDAVSKGDFKDPVVISGAKDAAHQKALLFGASEYERLAAASTGQAEAAERLATKAKKLRDRAQE